VAAAGAYGTGAAWAGNGQTGKLHPWVLVALFWSAALLSVLVHHLPAFLTRAAGWTQRSWHQHAPARARLQRRARLGLAQAALHVRRVWHRRATEWARRTGRARLTLARTAGSLVRSGRHLARGHAALVGAGTLAGLGWETARRAWEQHIAGARRAPGALIGWSRSARKALRV
jgi:hypothetical protein